MKLSGLDKEKIVVSFVIPTYNSEKYLEDCIESITSQNYNNIEIVVVDGGSKDNTLTILRRYEKQITKLISEPDEGIYDSINKGIKICNGDLIKILNSDDRLTNNSLDRAVETYKLSFKKFNDYNFIIMSTLVRINLKGEEIRIIGRHNNMLFFENLLHPSWYVPKEIYDKFGLYDLKYKIASDYEYFLRIEKSNVRLVKSLVPYTEYREGGASSGGTGKNEVFKIKKIYKGISKAILLKLQIELAILLSNIKKVIIK